MISALLWVALAAEPAKGDVSGVAKAAAEQAAQLKRAGDEAKVKCAPLETQPLEPEAEAKVGESVAAQLKPPFPKKLSWPK